MDLLRSALLIISFFAALKCTILCFHAWKRSNSDVWKYSSIHFLGWTCGAAFFSVAYFFGRPTMPLNFHYWIPNASTVIMIYGALGVSLAAFDLTWPKLFGLLKAKKRDKSGD